MNIIGLTDFLLLVAFLLVVIMLRRKQERKSNQGRRTTFFKTVTATLHGNLSELSLQSPVLGLSFYGQNAVVLSSFELMKSILSNQNLARDRPAIHGNLTESNQTVMGITWGSGDYWKTLKAHSRLHLRHLCADKNLMDSLIGKEIDTILNKIPMANDMTALDLRDLDLYSSCHRILLGILVGPVGNDDAESSLEIRNILDHYKQFVKPDNTMSSNDWYSYPSWFFNNLSKLSMPKGYADSVRRIVQAKARQIDDGDGRVGLIDSLLKTFSGSRNNATHTKTSVEQITATISDMCASGCVPMAHAIKWMIHLLAKYPNVQQNILQEVNDEDAKGHNISSIYRKATLFEVFRVGNVLPIPIPRCATSTFSINGFVVNKGCSIICNLQSVFKDRDYWGETVDAFIPERFLDSSGLKLIKTERMAIFGFGRRSCPGDSVVWTTLMSYLTESFVYAKRR